jgi:hypothetical protein
VNPRHIQPKRGQSKEEGNEKADRHAVKNFPGREGEGNIP